MPFAKTLPFWKTYESAGFERFPQRPHFTPLLKDKEDIRELSAVGMIVTFYGLLDEVKGLKRDDPMSKLKGLNVEFAKLKNMVSTPNLLKLQSTNCCILKMCELRKPRSNDVWRSPLKRKSVKVLNYNPRGLP